MSNKKKETVKTTEQKNVEVSSTSPTNISYKGIITIEKQFGNKTYDKVVCHNNGTNEFFRIILLAISGADVRSLMPKFIHTFNDKDESTCVTNIPYGDVSLKRTKESYELSFSFLIPFSQLYANTTSSKVKLFSQSEYNSSSKELASFELSRENQLVWDGVTNWLITWTMVVGNVAQ